MDIYFFTLDIVSVLSYIGVYQLFQSVFGDFIKKYIRESYA